MDNECTKLVSVFRYSCEGFRAFGSAWLERTHHPCSWRQLSLLSRVHTTSACCPFDEHCSLVSPCMLALRLAILSSAIMPDLLICSLLLVIFYSGCVFSTWRESLTPRWCCSERHPLDQGKAERNVSIPATIESWWLKDPTGSFQFANAFYRT